MRFRLAEYAHQSQARDVQTHRDHIRGYRAVHTLRVMKSRFQPPSCFRDLVGGNAGGEFDDFGKCFAIAEKPRLFTDAPAASKPFSVF